MSLAERSCLANFNSGDSANLITDLVVVDFDRTLLLTPVLGTDLLDQASRDVLNFQVANTWMQNATVLHVALELNEIDKDILDICLHASKTPSTLLVMTTQRPIELGERILQFLNKYQIKVDHFASSSSPDFPMCAKAKTSMLELMVSQYTFLERVYIFDRSLSDRKQYEKVIMEFARSNLHSTSSFHVCQLEHINNTLKPMEERALLNAVVKNLPNVTCSSVEVCWLWRLTAESKKFIVDQLLQLVPEDQIKFEKMESVISMGGLPLEMRGLNSIKMQPQQFKFEGFKVDQKRVFVNMVSGRFKRFNVEVAKLKSGLDVVGGGGEVQAYVYEKRELRVSVRPTSERGDISMR